MKPLLYPSRWPRSRPTFALEFIAQGLMLARERKPLQLIGPLPPSATHGLLHSPAADGLVIALQQHRRHPLPVALFRPRVVRVIEQTGHEGFLFGRQLVTRRPRRRARRRGRRRRGGGGAAARRV